MIDRFNTPQTDGIEVDLLGHSLLIKQDPNSKHLGTTVWDSSLVFVKFLERNCKKGEFSRAKLAGKRVIELGAGCGLAGLGMALLGCDVVVSDQIEVLPLLLRNVERNLSRAKYAAADNSYMGSIGKVDVAELDWGNETHIAAVSPPFDYIIGTDVVYKEQYIEPLINTILALAGPKTTVLLGYEFRSSGVRELLSELCQKHFSVKRVLHSKMDPKYQHPDIDLYIMRVLQKPGEDSFEKQDGSAGNVVDQLDESEVSGEDDGECVSQQNVTESGTPIENVQRQLEASLSVSKDSVFETRRQGSLAARLLSDIVPSRP
ncbi:hypothetical protein R1sor_023021 [Riccia sorocarpa]|uniref:N2,N2-dimethylguanosine tRNA methyltransferase n=1 Tax=Riccia sorocarpa TaxID=122646 RepID=A0ABD3GPU4_9MARC